MSELPKKDRSPEAASQLKLKDIARQLQILMLNEGITPEELVSCANAVKSSYDNRLLSPELALSPERMCHFCQKTTQKVKILIAGPGVNICDKCIQMCNEMIERNTQ
ncbi:ClpX C4-type zinc finger protein [Serratia marcescens]|uniref:ClpX C4-type zinc finger protein n=1 Tax=Serratia marcescens TaxID=615 RepID=UPI001C8AB2E9|nr:ClpX C4-type zinc finger protein [Serratia marcescens]